MEKFKDYTWVADKLVGGPLDGKHACIVEGHLLRREGALYRRTDEHVIEGSFKLRLWRHVDLRPKACPRCGRDAHFQYSTEEEALKQSPLCWGEDESDCPGFQKPTNE